MKIPHLAKQLAFGLSLAVFSVSSWAHGGAKGTDTDQCKFELEKDHWIHYTAYQPNAYPAEEFCANLPSINEATILVFDYQDQKYKDNTVEFEVTKEPEGKRVFFMEGAKHKKGTVELKLPNGVPEAGEYLIHITLVPDQGDRKDVHMAFKAGGGPAMSGSNRFLIILGVIGGLFFLYLSVPAVRKAVDGVIGGKKEA